MEFGIYKWGAAVIQIKICGTGLAVRQQVVKTHQARTLVTFEIYFKTFGKIIACDTLESRPRAKQACNHTGKGWQNSQCVGCFLDNSAKP